MDPDRYCPRCGRRMPADRSARRGGTPRKFCSKSCRRSPLTATDEALEAAIMDLLAQRAGGATICPSEAARAVAEDWRPLMEPARRAARRLWARDAIEILQGGRPVEPSTAKGPIRLRRRR